MKGKRMITAPGFVMFDEAVCCAIANAHVHDWSIAEKWPAFDRFRMNFERSNHLGFVPNEHDRSMLEMLIDGEMMYLVTSAPDVIDCGHTAIEHLLALQEIFEKLNDPILVN